MAVNYEAPIEIRDARNGSWFWVHTHVWRDPRLTNTDKVIYGTLASYTNNQQTAFPSISRLADESQLSKRHLYRTIKNLEKCGYLSVKRTKGKPNLYTLLKTRSAKMSPVTSMSLGSDTTAPTTSDTTAPLTISNITISNNNIPVSDKTGSKCPNKEEGHKGCIEFIQSFAKSRNTKFALYGKQIKAVHIMLTAGFNWNDINKQIDRMESDRFWKNHGFDLMNVATEIGKAGEYGNPR
jgi:predicted transcriptional regulator